MKKQGIYQQLSKYYDNYQITELLQKETDFTKNQLFLCEKIDTLTQEWLDNKVKLAKSGFPFEYVIQKAEFYGEEFYIDERVLIPRNDTEVMVEKVLDLITSHLTPLWIHPISSSLVSTGITLIDIWTGSSCIPISILKNTDAISHTYVADISKNALKVSKINIQKYTLDKKMTQLHGNLLTPIIPFFNKEELRSVKEYLSKNIIITANLPYILDKDFQNINNETIQYEPEIALYWGPVTWFELYEQLIQQCLELKKLTNIHSINLFIEIWFDQKEYSQDYLNKLWLKNTYYKDNWWIIRCIHIII